MSSADEADRISVDDDLLDEVVIGAVAGVQLKRLDVHRYRLLITCADGGTVELDGTNMELRDAGGRPVDVGPALEHCGHRWGRPGQEHTCTAHRAHRGQHRCDCGDRERNATVRGTRGR